STLFPYTTLFRSLLVARRRFVPVIAGLALVVAVLEQGAHVSLVEGPFVRQGEVIVDVSKVEADAITLSGDIHAIGIVDAARGCHGGNGLRGDRQRLTLYFLLGPEEATIPKDICHALALDAQTRRICF